MDLKVSFWLKSGVSDNQVTFISSDKVYSVYAPGIPPHFSNMPNNSSLMEFTWGTIFLSGKVD